MLFECKKEKMNTIELVLSEDEERKLNHIIDFFGLHRNLGKKHVFSWILRKTATEHINKRIWSNMQHEDNNGGVSIVFHPEYEDITNIDMIQSRIISEIDVDDEFDKNIGAAILRYGLHFCHPLILEKEEEKKISSLIGKEDLPDCGAYTNKQIHQYFEKQADYKCLFSLDNERRDEVFTSVKKISETQKKFLDATILEKDYKKLCQELYEDYRLFFFDLHRYSYSLVVSRDYNSPIRQKFEIFNRICSDIGSASRRTDKYYNTESVIIYNFIRKNI